MNGGGGGCTRERKEEGAPANIKAVEALAFFFFFLRTLYISTPSVLKESARSRARARAAAGDVGLRPIVRGVYAGANPDQRIRR